MVQFLHEEKEQAQGIGRGSIRYRPDIQDLICKKINKNIF